MRTKRINISVPLDLHASMLATIRQANWSAIACRAFRRRVDREVRTRKVSNKAAVAADCRP